MEFYGSEATILTEVKIHQTHITQHHRSIFAYYMSNVYGSNTLVYGYI